MPSPTRSPPHDDYDHHTASPCQSPTPQPDPAKPCSPTPPPPPPPAKPKRKRAPPTLSSIKFRSPKRKLSPLPKVPHANSHVRPYDRTREENERICKEQYEAWKRACAERRKPEPRPVFTKKQKRFAKDFLTTPCQYDLHYKPDDNIRTLQKEGIKKRSRESASGRKS